MQLISLGSCKGWVFRECKDRKPAWHERPATRYNYGIAIVRRPVTFFSGGTYILGSVGIDAEGVFCASQAMSAFGWASDLSNDTEDVGK